MCARGCKLNLLRWYEDPYNPTWKAGMEIHYLYEFELARAQHAGYKTNQHIWECAHICNKICARDQIIRPRGWPLLRNKLPTVTWYSTVHSPDCLLEIFNRFSLWTRSDNKSYLHRTHIFKFCSSASVLIKPIVYVLSSWSGQVPPLDNL